MSRRSILLAVAGGTVVVVVIMVVVSRVRAPADHPAKTGGPASVTYVGRQACVGCHEREHDLWLGSHHDLAMQPADRNTVLGDFEGVTVTRFDVTSTFSRRGDGFFVRTDGPDGAIQEYRITHTFGVTPLQQYLVELPRGRYQVLPLCWDSRPAADGGQRWFHIYPDEAIGHDDLLHWTGPNQNWNFMCAECHSTDLRKRYDPKRDEYNTTWSEIDVSCEACHGPGSRHVAWARAASDGEPYPHVADMGLTVSLKNAGGGGWVMDMQTGTARRTVPRSSDAELETCARCHSRRVQIHDEYVHGRPLLDTHVPSRLDAPLYHADGQILDEVYVYGSFLQSGMHREGVTCSDCHEPHSLELLAPGNLLCLRCHLVDRFDTPAHHFHEPDGPGASCVECHMPARTYMVVDPRHDHSLRIPRPDLSVALGTPNACNGCHDDKTAAWAAAAAQQWYGTHPPHYGEVLFAGRAGEAGADRALAELATDTDQPGIARATALSLLRADAGPEALSAVETALGDDDPLVRVAAVGTLEAAPPRQRVRLASPLLGDPVRAVRVRAARVLASAAVLEPPADGAAFAAAADEYIRSELTNADRPESHVNLGNFFGAGGNLEQAEAAYRTALRLDPRHVPAHVNLADLLRAQGRDDEGESVLREAIRITPEAAAAHHALGLLLVRAQRMTSAVETLGRAAELEPDNARFGLVHALALDAVGRSSEALLTLERTQRRHPNDRDLLMALATRAGGSGRLDEAIRYARRLVRLAPDEPAYARLLAELESRQP